MLLLKTAAAGGLDGADAEGPASGATGAGALSVGLISSGKTVKSVARGRTGSVMPLGELAKVASCLRGVCGASASPGWISGSGILIGAETWEDEAEAGRCRVLAAKVDPETTELVGALKVAVLPDVEAVGEREGGAECDVGGSEGSG